MQDRYVGDIGDFGKYGLLRSLAADLSLGVVWYLVPDESHTNDGKDIRYLQPTLKNLTTFRDCDTDLYDMLGGIVRDSARSVKSVHERGVLPAGTVSYDDRLTYQGMPGIGPDAKDARLAHRRLWVGRALAATPDCKIVFLDPDNGIECRTTQRHEKRGPKYVYFDDVQAYLTRGQSVVIYHHFNYGSTPISQTHTLFARLNERLVGHQQMSALRYHRGSTRAFVVIPTPDHAPSLTRGVQRFMASPWSQHFSSVTPPDRPPAIPLAEGRIPANDTPVGSDRAGATSSKPARRWPSLLDVFGRPSYLRPRNEGW